MPIGAGVTLQVTDLSGGESSQRGHLLGPFNSECGAPDIVQNLDFSSGMYDASICVGMEDARGRSEVDK